MKGRDSIIEKILIEGLDPVNLNGDYDSMFRCRRQGRLDICTYGVYDLQHINLLVTADVLFILQCIYICDFCFMIYGE